MNGERKHRVWVAFLRLDNDEYHAEASLRTYCCLPMNSITVWLTQRPWIHCQLVFWDAEAQQYFTFSVDTIRPVHVFDRKEFKAGWDFIELRVTEESELRIYNFLVQQLSKTMNSTGQMTALFCPIDSGGERWFCSELVAAALEAGGVIDFATWEGVGGPYAVVMHQLYDYLRYSCKSCEVRVMSTNPVSVMGTLNTLDRSTERFSLWDRDGNPMNLGEVASRINRR
jgi:hypothetical protein